MDEKERLRKRIQVISSYAMIPFMLGVPPIIGWYIGSWIDDYFNISPYGKYILLLLGFIGGVREAYRTIKKFKDEEI